MYIVEFEKSRKDGQDITRVQLIDPTANDHESKIIAETVYLGEPPNLTFQAGATFAAIKLQRNAQTTD